MLLLVGLGNPGSKYAANRHNIGFMCIDAIMRAHGFPTMRRRFQGLASEGTIGAQRVILLEPQTYMNESGRSVSEATRFHKIATSDVLVFHDELDLAAGKLRIKKGGGNAGHNGLRSISAHIGNDYRRVRLGIGHPGAKELVHGHVLSDFARAEQPWVDALCDAVADHVALVAGGNDAEFQNRVHRAMEDAGFGDAGQTKS